MENTWCVNSQDVRQLKDKLYSLKPSLVINNNRLAPDFLHVIDRALSDNELIKIRTQGFSYNELTAIAKHVCDKAEAVLVQSMGGVIAIYRKNMPIEETESAA